MSDKNYDLIVIGAGPGGYVAAIRAAQLGVNVALVEKESALGGTCLRVGCIPSKALLDSSARFAFARDELGQHGVALSNVSLDLAAMMNRKNKTVDSLTKGIASLIKKNKITRVHGSASFLDPQTIQVAQKDADPKQLSAKHVLIATGSRPAALRGVDWDPPYIGTSTDALQYDDVPSHLVVIGAGVIGLELGSVWRRLGSKVTVVEYLERILPGMDQELAAQAQKILQKQGLQFHLGAKVTAVNRKNKGCQVEMEGRDPIQCDRVLVAVGREPNTEGLQLDRIGLDTDKKGRITVDEKFQTQVEGIYAIGDVIPGPMLAHKAEEEGVAMVEGLFEGHGHVDYHTIPAVVYTEPEIASVGRTEEELKEAGVAFRRGQFPFRANGRALASGETQGWVKILADEKTDRMLGVHIIGPHAGELINETAAAMAFGASSEDLARCCHAHPTLAETLKEAALAVQGRAIHY